MIGIDLTSIKRFKNKKLNFVQKVLSDDEFLEWQNIENKELYLAQRWSIKEAIFKANNDFHDFKKINIKRNSKGVFEFQDFKISTSKENEYVIAFGIGGLKC